MTLLVPGLLILGILGLIGAGLFLTLMEVRQTRVDIQHRVGLISEAVDNTSVSDAAKLLTAGRARRRRMLGARLRRAFAVALPRTWGMTASAPVLMLTAAAGGGITWLVVQPGLHMSIWISPELTLAGLLLLPRYLLKYQQNVADKKFMELFPDSIDMIIRMLRAGLPVTAAVRAVGKEAASPVAEVFTSLADEMAIGITFEDALSAAGERIELADFRFFAVAVSLQRATGGNLAATLDILSDIMRKRRAMRLQAKATTGEVRMSAYVLGVIPFFIIGGILVITPDYLRPLIVDPRGKVIIAVAVTSMLIGFGTIRQMMLSVTRAA
jgi:tight adherence protein B